MNAVSVAAQAVVFEVRRQFEEIPGLAQGTARPEYGTCVAIVTSTALRQLVVPGAIAVVVAARGRLRARAGRARRACCSGS